MTTRHRSIIVYGLICLSVLLAFAPVILSNNYLRQDDLMWEIWPGMKMSDFGFLYYNTVYQLVRPLCMLSFFITDLISITIQHAVYIRFLSLVCIAIMGIMLYHWQLRFNANRLLAVTFAICAFTLPPFQIFAATQNYFLILTALLLTFGAQFFWYNAFNHQQVVTKKRYYWLGNLLFFASLLEYPLSSMYVFTLLTIYYLNTTIIFTKPPLWNKFFNVAVLNTLAITVFYFILIKLFHKIFHVNLSYGRPAVIDTSHLFARFLGIFDVMSWHSNLWLWDNTTGWLNSPILGILALFAGAVFYSKRQFTWSTGLRLIQYVGVLFTLFFLAYSPIMASSEKIITFRYAIATMPLLLYIVFWSITVLMQRLHWLRSVILIGITIFGIGYTNMMLADGVVGPHEHDFAFIQQQLKQHVIPLIQQNKKVVLHMIDCDNGNSYQFAPAVPVAFEYGMRVCSYQQQIIGVVIHSLNRLGYPSNFNKHNTTIYNTDEIIVKDTPWGDLIVNNTKQSPGLDSTQAATLVTVDMHASPPYQQFEFYRHLMQKLQS